MQRLIYYIKILNIHFIRKTIFIFRLKLGLIFYPRKYSPSFFLESNNYTSIEFINALLDIQSKNVIISEAELILQNKFQTLGSEITFLGETINWHKDFKSGRIWRKDFYTKINSKQTINKSDIKVPWELSRFHQAIWLAKTYLITKDEKYSVKFFEILNDWIDENPFGYGINWNCSMEIAIRAVNWILALHIFKHSPNFTDEIKLKIYRSLFQHGLFIRNNLEFGRRNGNHYLSDLMGLIWLGAFFFDYRFGKKWLNFAMGELEREIQVQVYEDGVDYEKSTFYQRLVTEIFYLSKIAIESLGKNFSKAFNAKLKSMTNFIASYTLDEEIPNIGDCDDGRVLKFSLNDKISEMRNTLTIGSIIFDTDFLKNKSKSFYLDALFLLGVNKLKYFLGNKFQPIEISSKGFDKGGFYILRSQRIFTFIDAGDIGMNGWGGHGHNDCLNFEFAVDNIRFIVDSGTYVYTPEPKERQKFRSTYSHNTITIDDAEQADFLNLFRIKNDFTKPDILKYLTTEELDLLIAQHHGFTRIHPSLIHRREFTLNKKENTLTIIDNIFGEGIRKINSFIHFHPNVVLEKLSDKIYNISRQKINVRIEFDFPSNFDLKITDWEYSESYGRKTNNKKITIEGIIKLPTVISIKLILFE